jgi:predicted Zn-dependent protease
MLKEDPTSRRARLLLAALDLKEGDLSAAMLSAEALVSERPGDEAALNLKSAIEMKKGDFMAAEKSLDSCIMSNPRGYAAYYNMARLYLVTRGASGKDAARRIYETGRKYGGPADAALEAALK